MRMLRSIVCAGLAMIAVSLCASMPAAAAVPIDVQVAAQPMTGVEHPAPARGYVIHDVAVLPSEAPNIEGDGGARSPLIVSSRSFASSTFAVQPYRHIDPGRMRS